MIKAEKAMELRLQASKNHDTIIDVKLIKSEDGFTVPETGN